MKNFNAVYGQNADFNKAIKRIEKLKQTFFREFSLPCDNIFSSSGRIELLGNHTDHNHGIVLVGAINQDILAACCKNDHGNIIIKSEGFDDISFNVNDTSKRESEKGKSIALVRGVIEGFRNKGFIYGGFSATIISNVFKGAGVSSSAAYEVLISEILNFYYNNGKVTPLEKAQISQYAESEYFGKPCGLLDQSGIAFGGINRMDFNNIENPEILTITPDFSNYSIVITNCGGDHSNLTPEYAAVKDDMNAISKFFGKNYLREVPAELFYSSIAKLKEKTGGRAILRAIHFYEENKRVNLATKALQNKDMQTFLKCVNESGESSYKLLQNCYAKEDSYQGIPLGLELSKQLLKGQGAVRVHGGGFAGTIIAFIPDNIYKEYSLLMQNVFGKENVINISIRTCGATRLEI